MAIGRKPRLLEQVKRIYLDHAATTPVVAQAREAMARALGCWANPSSPHADGRSARAALEQARRRVRDSLEWEHDLIFTSGATEAIAIAASRARASGRAHGATEHDAVPAAMGDRSRIIPVDAGGLLDLDALDAVLSAGPCLVAVQQVNNETGVIQPLDSIAERVAKAGSLFLADCAQSAGKLPLPQADLIAISAHKFGGPPGCGALLVRDPALLEPCGGQEKGYRRGTENLPAAAGMAAALESRAFAEALPRLMDLRQHLDALIVEQGGSVIAADSPRSPAIGAYSMPGVASAAQLVQFDLAGISVSAGSACSSGSLKPSRVHQEMGLGPELAASVVRVSFGPDTTQDQINRFAEEWRRMRSRSGARAA